tara:strand:+ start:9130 stop:9900 length:771 start_codon:yes stop_codon:yes gene_type:complete
MSKYKRNEEPEDTLSYSEEMNQQQSAPEPAESEEASFKKRYGDLRRHTQQLVQQKDQEIQGIKNQLDSAAKGQIKFPKTDEEIDAWTRKYPDVAKIVDTIAQKRAGEAMAEGDKRMEGLRQLETKLTRQEAEQQLLKTHPDFNDIRQDASFHEWVGEQPQSIQDALYKNNTNARDAARAIDLYKADTGKRKSPDKRSAAQAVGKTSRSNAPANQNMSFTESQVESMSVRDFEKHEDAIMEAMRSGKFNYDVSGGAR